MIENTHTHHIEWELNSAYRRSILELKMILERKRDTPSSAAPIRLMRRRPNTTAYSPWAKADNGDIQFLGIFIILSDFDRDRSHSTEISGKVEE